MLRSGASDGLRKVAWASLTTLFATGGFSQVDLGLKAGANYNVWSPIEFNWYQLGTYPEANYSGPGFHIGAMLRGPVSGRVAFQGELLYSMRDVGNKMDASITYFDGFVEHTQRVHGTDEFRLRYVDVPLLFCLHADDQLDLQLGPLVGFGLHSQRTGSFTLEDTFSGSTDTRPLSYDLTDEVISGRTDLGIAAGLGYEWDAGFQLGLRYMRGLTSTRVSDNAVYWSTPGVGIHQSAFQFSMGFWFSKR